MLVVNVMQGIGMSVGFILVVNENMGEVAKQKGFKEW